jgi:thymidine kinase
MEMVEEDRCVFGAICPECGQDATQERRRSELCQSLASEADIEAYCVKCDAHWKLTEEERDRLAHNFMLE